MKMFFPTEFSFGFSYRSSTIPTPTTDEYPSVSADGNGTGIKWLVYSPDVGTARCYLNAPNDFRAVNQLIGNGRLALEANPSAQQDLNIVFPRGQWVTLETAVKVSNTGSGYFRFWLDGVLIASIGGASGTENTISGSAAALTQWGLGDYWNGAPWTDGVGGRDTFYVDEVIVATDISGFGAPTATDINGYPMIGVDVKNSDFH